MLLFFDFSVCSDIHIEIDFHAVQTKVYSVILLNIERSITMTLKSAIWTIKCTIKYVLKDYQI